MLDLSVNIVPELIESISQIIVNARRRVVASINSELIVTYWTVGKEIVDKEQNNNIDNQTSRQIILQLSRQLTQTLGTGFSRSNLFNMRKLYIEFPNVQTVSGHISWSHICELLLIDNHNKRNFYLSQIQNENLSVRDLRRKMARMEYERALSNSTNVSTDLSLAVNNFHNPESIVKDPYVLDFLGIPENEHLEEYELENCLITHLEKFLLELGNGFMFVGRQKRITINNTHYYVDLVFYNKILRSYVLIELKTRKLQAEDGGQVNTYLNYYKTEINDEYDNPPIGIILCAEKDEIAAEYILSGFENNIFASKFVTVLPDKRQLEEQVKYVIENQRNNKF
ncbi:MAG: PDDEXK nuclease domain-containing protein [Prevotellaceae bacterium]|jgi:predicted nuclease of restriction endonuclease-like (RecB) superfamily|nr:PDDEXK nuclease domain-containing protein [Prevotellaceae bacterium]